MNKLLTGITAILALNSQASFATSISLDEFTSPEFRAYFGGGNTFEFQYDYTTQVFSSTITGISGYDANNDNLVDGHITGSIVTTAIIDHAGNVQSGNVQWIGGDAANGIADGTLLLNANVVGLNVARYTEEYLPGISPGGDSPVFQVILQNIQSEASLDLADYLEFRMFQQWPVVGGELPLNPFQSSFVGLAYTGSELWNIQQTQVPVPATLWLFGTGLLIIGRRFSTKSMRR